ncbi:MAG: hypothetical protein A2X28_06550 [Elusimicrobia bacterium GWA2_56_46]|nr:MAG: hypothetical protein A2X28_06550 [Elusimicrobia bacterium GWA2_56_46]OGR54888.1 MAG: hypothetical protein A2X39_11440 [Elusimicrobia bacterium GWC2_56_31]HBB67296.1 hypothetical protein [Elusimicrobiota bacterium]HBW23316.1 hypothetical protein [Elusimicrobiota bacterium]
MKKLTLTAALALLAPDLYSAGFRLAEQSASAAGMGNAFVAAADDASAAWYNPAALADLEKTHLSLGSVMVYPLMEHANTAANGGQTDRVSKKLHFPPHFYATHKLNGKWAFGLGVNAPFGLETNWDKEAANTRTVATFSMIRTTNYNLNAAYKVTEKLSFGLGVDWVSLTAEMDKIIAGSIEQTLKGSGTGLSYNAAALYNVNKWRFGTGYRSKVKITVDGGIKLPVPGPSAADGDAGTKITLPDTFQLGAACKYGDKWLFSAEADYTNWAVYHKLVIDYTTTAGAAAVSTENKLWKSVWAFRLGARYNYSAAWKFRAGAFYDMTPVPSGHFETRVPDADRLAFSLGACWTKGDVTVDAAYMYLMFMERAIRNSAGGTASTINARLDGKYNASAHLPALTVSYKF